MTNSPPDFIIAGAPKAGTTSLYHYLSQHPTIFMPEKKEPVFFCNYQSNFRGPGSKWYNHNLVHDEQEYLHLFSKASPDSLTGEASTDYLSCPQAPLRIKKWNSKTKIIIFLRNPIDRAFSEHMHLVRDMLEKESFLQALHLEKERIEQGYIPLFWHVRRGLYYESVKRFIEVFGKENVKIVLFENLMSDRRGVMEDLFRFLNIPEISVDTSDDYNISGAPKSKMLQSLLSGNLGLINTLITMSTSTRLRRKMGRWLSRLNLEKIPMTQAAFDFLREAFSQDLKQTMNLLEIDLSHWLEQREL